MNEERLGKLTKIVIRGFKSIRYCELDLRAINVLIGANGAGKSNFLSALELLQSVLARGLSYYGAKKGVDNLFHNGKAETDSIIAEFYFGDDIYMFDIGHTENNNLFISMESLYFNGKHLLGEGEHSESMALNTLRSMQDNADVSTMMLNPGWIVYRFQDTTASSRKKGEQEVSNDVAFMSDGRNLAAFLYRLKRSFPKDYAAIIRSVQLVAPFFEDFILSPKELNDEQIELRWQHKENKVIYGASQLSDGTLRFICLATLLLQPEELQPSILIIDEPELGLHPFAISIFAEMVHKVAVDKQVIIATQSADLLNCFTADDIIVVDYDKEGSGFERKSNEQLAYWLEKDYSLGELWNNNILGGRFAR
ncbi:MAG: AAA family ATPase [Defluviitaleaceae bacterium]|nr:AAA family ATPase [Defluviitaleaceae bacterium]MCL2276012.1 AAA family ATPase [Defluviitaleaceae bacterium]